MREEKGGKLIQESYQFVIMTKGVGTYLEEAAYQGVGAYSENTVCTLGTI